MAIFVKWFLKFLNRAQIEITQFLTFSVIFESYLNWGFFINRKNIIVVYCFGTEFVKFTVREIKD